MDDLNQYKSLYLETARQYVQTLNKCLLVLEKNSTDTEAIEEIFRSAHSLKSQSAAMGYVSTGFLCHTIEDIFYEIKNNNLAIDKKLADQLFSSFDALDSSLKNIDKQSAEIDLSPQVQSLKSYTGVKTEGSGKSVRVSSPVVSAKDDIKSIPVNVKRLDDILNLLEEILVERFELKKIAKDLNHNGLMTHYDKTQKIIDSLQYEIMQARMVPLQLIFDHYPRTVRDIASQENKEVELIMDGGELSLDRKIVEKLDEPLIHLLRNAVSHGIKQKGKVTISAHRESEFMILDISDDGQGIDWEKLRSKVDKKSIDIENKEALLFSGTSTSDMVTEVSGRGVGLLAVKKMVQDLGGFVNAKDNQPSGTIFTLKLPLSLSIVKSLLVSVSGHKYALPASLVHRSIIVLPEQIKITADQETMVLNELEVPLVRLSERFGYAAPEGNKEIVVVIINQVDNKIGYIVDNVLETADLIVKPVPEVFPKTFFGGATVLANGEVALVINSSKLI